MPSLHDTIFLGISCTNLSMFLCNQTGLQVSNAISTAVSQIVHLLDIAEHWILFKMQKEIQGLKSYLWPLERLQRCAIAKHRLDLLGTQFQAQLLVVQSALPRTQ